MKASRAGTTATPRAGDRRPGNSGVGAHGFTLLEVLIAFIIAAIALSVLFSGSLSGLTSVQAATGYEQAVARARSRLAAEAASPSPGDREGDDGGGFRWRVRVRPVETYRPKPAEDEAAPAQSASPPFSVTLYAIDVAISWSTAGRVRTVQLQTERLAPSASGNR